FVAAIHRLRLPHCPFFVIYRSRASWIEVLAVAHGRRRPGYWREAGADVILARGFTCVDGAGLGLSSGQSQTTKSDGLCWSVLRRRLSDNRQMRRFFAIGIIAAFAAAAQGLTPDDRKASIDSFEKVWTTVHDKHWDPKFNGVDWKAIHDELRPKVEAA